MLWPCWRIHFNSSLIHTHTAITSLPAWEMESDTRSNFLKYWSARVKHFLTRRAIYGRGLTSLVQRFSPGRTFNSTDSPRTGWNIALWAQQSRKQQSIALLGLSGLQLRTKTGQRLMMFHMYVSTYKITGRLRKAYLNILHDLLMSDLSCKAISSAKLPTGNPWAIPSTWPHLSEHA